MTKRRRDPIHSNQIGRPSAPRPPRPGQNYLDQVLATQHDISELGAAAYITPLSAFLSLSQLRGFWPMSSVNHADEAYDVSGQGRKLSKSGTLSYKNQALSPYCDFDGTGYLTIADHPALSITGGITFGAWVYLNSGFSDVIFIGKHGASGGGQLSYGIAAGTVIGTERFQLHISDDGSNEETVYVEPADPIGAWNFVVGRFSTGGAAAIFCNEQKATATFTATSIFDATTNFTLGVSPYTGATTYLDGRLAYPFLAAATAEDEVIAHIFNATRAIFGR